MPATLQPATLICLKKRLRIAMGRITRSALLCLAIGFAVLGFAAPAYATPLEVNWALAAEGDGNTFPVTNTAREVNLPDEWAVSRPGARGPVWYRSAFITHPDENTELLRAIYIAQVCSNLEIYLNSRLIFRAGSMAEPYAQNCNLPLLVPLPAGLLSSGVNGLDIKVVGHRLEEVGSRHRAAQLGVIEVGTLAELAPRHRWQSFLQVSAPQAVSLSLLLLGCVLFVMGFLQRQDSHLAYLGVLAVGWGLVDARLWLHELPLHGAAREFLVLSMLPFLTLAAVQFLLRFAKKWVGWVNYLLPAQCALMPATLILGGAAHLHLLAVIWYCLLTIEVSMAAVLCVPLARKRPGWVWLVLTLLAFATTGLIAIATQLRMLPIVAVQVAHLLPPLLLLVLGMRLLQQPGRTALEAEQSKLLFELRVRDATAELERGFAQRTELKLEQVTERERKRIAADLHDDLGAKLLTIVHTSESERISTLAREALEEMRLSVRGLTGKAVQLADALGDWRAEVISRLSQAGIEAQWNAPDDLPQRLSARAYVQTTRILREITSNIIKHSGASRCTVTCAVEHGDFVLVVQDNGNGIRADIDERIDRGHGLASMKQRAKQLQGQCLVESGPGYGTVIRLTLPLDKAALDA